MFTAKSFAQDPFKQAEHAAKIADQARIEAFRLLGEAELTHSKNEEKIKNTKLILSGEPNLMEFSLIQTYNKKVELPKTSVWQQTVDAAKQNNSSIMVVKNCTPAREEYYFQLAQKHKKYFYVASPNDERFSDGMTELIIYNGEVCYKPINRQTVTSLPVITYNNCPT